MEDTILKSCIVFCYKNESNALYNFNRVRDFYLENYIPITMNLELIVINIDVDYPYWVVLVFNLKFLQEINGWIINANIRYRESHKGVEYLAELRYNGSSLRKYRLLDRYSHELDLFNPEKISKKIFERAISELNNKKDCAFPIYDELGFIFKIYLTNRRKEVCDKCGSFWRAPKDCVSCDKIYPIYNVEYGIANNHNGKIIEQGSLVFNNMNEIIKKFSPIVERNKRFFDI